MMTTTNFQEDINIVINKGKASNLTTAGMATILTNAATALGTDTTTHSREIEAPPAVLKPDLGN